MSFLTIRKAYPEKNQLSTFFFYPIPQCSWTMNIFLIPVCILCDDFVVNIVFSNISECIGVVCCMSHVGGYIK